MDKPSFVYVIYMRTTPEALWEALIQPECTRRYWAGTHQESEWEVGAAWRLMTPDGRAADEGEVLEIDRPRRLVVSWRNNLFDELHAIGFTTAMFDLEPKDSTVKLTVTHEAPAGGEAFLAAVSQGWPHILSSLKSMLETGAALPGSDRWPEGI